MHIKVRTSVPYSVPYSPEVRRGIMNIYSLSRGYSESRVPTYLTYLYPGMVSITAAGEEANRDQEEVTIINDSDNVLSPIIFLMQKGIVSRYVRYVRYVNHSITAGQRVYCPAYLILLRYAEVRQGT